MNDDPVFWDKTRRSLGLLGDPLLLLHMWGGPKSPPQASGCARPAALCLHPACGGQRVIGQKQSLVLLLLYNGGRPCALVEELDIYLYAYWKFLTVQNIPYPGPPPPVAHRGMCSGVLIIRSPEVYICPNPSRGGGGGGVEK